MHKRMQFVMEYHSELFRMAELAEQYEIRLCQHSVRHFIFVSLL